MSVCSCKHIWYVTFPKNIWMDGCSDGSITENLSIDCEQNTQREGWGGLGKQTSRK